MTPTIAELREVWSAMVCPDPNLPHEAGCPAALAFDAWFSELRSADYDRGYSDGYDARG